MTETGRPETRQTETVSVTLTRTFDAPIERVYRAWAEAEHLVRWMKCDRHATLQVENWVPEVGGAFQTRMFQPEVFDARGTGVFTEVDPPRLLAYTIHADPSLGTPVMSVRVELASRGDRTELVLTQTGIPSEKLRGIIEAGWTNSLGLLAETLERQAKEVES